MIGCVVHLVFLAVVLGAVAFLGTISLEYTVETWAHAMGHTTVDVPAGNPMVWVAGLVTSEVAIPAALITYVASVAGLLA